MEEEGREGGRAEVVTEEEGTWLGLREAAAHGECPEAGSRKEQMVGLWEA